MVAGKVKQAMGLTSKPDKPSPKPKPKPTSKPAPAPVPPPRTFGTYLTRSSAQVQPRPPDISIPDLLNLVEELRDRESRLRTELVELKLLHEMEVAGKVSHIDKLKLRVAELEAENERLVDERDVVKAQKNARIAELVEEVKQLVAAQQFQGLVEVGNKSTLIKNLYTKKLSASFNNEKDNDSGACVTFGDNLRTFASNCQRSDGNNLKALANNCRGSNDNNIRNADNLEVFASNCRSNNVDNLEAFATNCQNNNRNNTVVKYRDNLEAFAINCRSNNYNNNNNNAVNNGDNLDASTINCRSNSSNEAGDDVSESSLLRCRVPRVPKPPPKSTSCVSPPQQPRAVESTSVPPPPPPPMKKLPSISPPPPPPPAPTNAVKSKASKVKRVPEVVEFYHSLMRRDSRKESGVATAETTMTTTATSAKNLVGEIENRSAYLLAIKTDVETQGDFIGFLIKEVETAAFTDIEDVVSFVKWLDDELSYLVDERAVLKHFDWPEQKADALREAAFEYSDLKKLESEASSFRHDARQACSTTLKKMQTLLEKLEHGAYNLSRLRESATNRFKLSHIPVDWMLDTGFVSQIKLASVKLAMKYMKRVLAELEIVGGGPEEEELIVLGVRFAFRVHQFAGGFDVETMTAFEELRDKARSYHLQSQKKQLERLACRSMPC